MKTKGGLLRWTSWLRDRLFLQTKIQGRQPGSEPSLVAEEPPDQQYDGDDAPDVVEIPISDELDLHPFRPNETADIVREYLEEAIRRGFREVRIVHGRGIGVQREIVRKVLARDPRVISFADAPADRGGWGATVAELRIATGDERPAAPG